MLSGQALYDQLSSMNLGSISDDQFKSMGFGRGRQDAIDTLARLRDQYDPMAIASKAQQMQIEANQPAIQTLQGQQGDLKDRYTKLLDSITQSEQPALNSTIQATNNELGKRGISGDSSLAQQQIAQAQLPVTTQFGQLQANTGVSEQQDLGQLAANIASLQAGNIPGALNFASGINQQQEALQAAQLAANAQVTSSQNYANPNNYVVPAGGNLINTLTGKTTSPNAFTPTPLVNTLNNRTTLTSPGSTNTPFNPSMFPVNGSASSSSHSTSLPLTLGVSGISGASASLR